MFKIGCHLSSSNGYLCMAETATSIGANTFQFFTRNPRGKAAKEIDLTDVKKFLDYTSKTDISLLVAHSPYTLNACSSDERIRQFAKEVMLDDLMRLDLTPGNFYNFHPGSHVGQGIEQGIEYIVEMLDCVYKDEFKTKVLLETMAGKGSEVGGRFEELKLIMDKSGKDLGVCLDTCHVWDAGYDIVNRLDYVLDEFDKIIGLDNLCAIHLNDSLNDLGAKKDRHAKIGEGKIGLKGISGIINHKALKNKPFILETPNDVDGYGKEITLLKSIYEG